MSSATKIVKHWGNRYTYLEKIGKGAYGTVYKVKDIDESEGQGSIKVLKEISIETMDKDEIDECAREGKLLSKLNHKNIVQFFDSFCYSGFYCIITEFCECGDLNKVLISTKEKGAHLEERRILRWFIEIINGLDYIHKRKVLHRDLKPRNIFLKADSVKIGDFGISRILNFTMDFASTFLGTPYYMSPEVLKHDGYNTTSDIWSVGVILYEMCALQHAYEGQSIMNVMLQILEGPCPKIPSFYSENLQNVLENVLIKDPTKRPSAKEILELPFIKITIHDPWIDCAQDIDLSETLIKKETIDISNFMSKPIDIKTLASFSELEQVKLTPKQQLQLQKKLKADEEAEKQKKFVQATYRENQEVSKKIKENSSIDSLPFTRSRRGSSTSTASEYDYLNSSRNFGSKTVIANSQKVKIHEPFFNTEKLQRHFQKDQHTVQETRSQLDGVNDSHTFTRKQQRPSLNQHEMYDMKYSNFTFDNPAKCHITTYDSVDDAFNLEIEQDYCSDFESDSNSLPSQNSQDCDDELLDEATQDKYQDDINTDPFGINVKEKKINTMKKKCLEKIDEKTLKKALEYLEKNINQGNYLSGLRKICQSDDVAMTVDQLHFLRRPTNSLY